MLITKSKPLKRLAMKPRLHLSLEINIYSFATYPYFTCCLIECNPLAYSLLWFSLKQLIIEWKSIELLEIMESKPVELFNAEDEPMPTQSAKREN